MEITLLERKKVVEKACGVKLNWFCGFLEAALNLEN